MGSISWDKLLVNSEISWLLTQNLCHHCSSIYCKQHRPQIKGFIFVLVACRISFSFIEHGSEDTSTTSLSSMSFVCAVFFNGALWLVAYCLGNSLIFQWNHCSQQLNWMKSSPVKKVPLEACKKLHYGKFKPHWVSILTLKCLSLLAVSLIIHCSISSPFRPLYLTFPFYSPFPILQSIHKIYSIPLPRGLIKSLPLYINSLGLWFKGV